MWDRAQISAITWGGAGPIIIMAWPRSWLRPTPRLSMGRGWGASFRQRDEGGPGLLRPRRVLRVDAFSDDYG